MLEEIVKQLIYLKPMIFTSAVGMILFMVSFLIVCNKFSFQEKNLKFIGFFYEMKVTDSIALAVSMLKLFLIFSLIFTKGRIQTIHIVVFVLLVVIFNVCEHRIKECLVSFFNSTVIVGVLLLIKFLSSYMADVLFDARILIAIVLMIAFLLMYALYDVAYCAATIVSKRFGGRVNEKKQ